MVTPAFEPFRLKACPTFPVVYVVPPTSVPLFVPTLSTGLPSPRHQLILFSGEVIGHPHEPPVSEKLSNVTDVISFEPGWSWSTNSRRVSGEELLCENIRLLLK